MPYLSLIKVECSLIADGVHICHRAQPSALGDWFLWTGSALPLHPQPPGVEVADPASGRARKGDT